MSAQPESLDVTTQKISFDYESDNGPARHRIGLIALDSDVATESDFHNMLPEDVMFYTTRIPTVNPLTLDNLRQQAPMLTDAVRKLLPNQRLDSVAYSCTSGTVAIGYDKVAELVRKGDRPDVPVVTPITSAIAALEALEVERITLLTPYIDSVNQAMRGFLEEHGITVLNIGSFSTTTSTSPRCPPRPSTRRRSRHARTTRRACSSHAPHSGPSTPSNGSKPRSTGRWSLRSSRCSGNRYAPRATPNRWKASAG